MDKALAKVKLPGFRSSEGLSGDGVIVGIVDTGIDPNHPDFVGRILRIWDQTVSGPGVAEGSFGLELTGPLISASRDTDGHGTHVAGIAAGAGTKFSGVAPKANFVIVKTSFQDAHIADGIRYIFRVAEQPGRPAVVNLSLADISIRTMGRIRCARSSTMKQALDGSWCVRREMKGPTIFTHV